MTLAICYYISVPLKSDKKEKRRIFCLKMSTPSTAEQPPTAKAAKQPVTAKQSALDEARERYIINLIRTSENFQYTFDNRGGKFIRTFTAYKMTRSSLEVGMKCIKYMLLCITAIFVLTSALIISVGTTIYAIYHDVSFFLDDRFFSPATFVIVIGIIMLFVSLFGCVGALKESTCLVNIFAVILSLVFVLEIAAAITAYSLRSSVTGMLDEKLRITLPYYYHNEEVEDAFDFIQSRLNCCGVDSYMDWSVVTPPQGVSGISISNITVPNSCCAESRYEIVGDLEIDECTKLYANGCLPRVFYLVYQSAGLLGAGAMTIAFIQIIGIVFSFSLASSIRKAKSERERRRWEIQERVINAYTSLNPDNEKKAPVVYVPFHGQATA